MFVELFLASVHFFEITCEEDGLLMKFFVFKVVLMIVVLVLA